MTEGRPYKDVAPPPEDVVWFVFLRSRGANQQARATAAGRRADSSPSVTVVRSIRSRIGLHPAVPAQRTCRRRHRQRALRASRSRPRQRVRRGHDQRAPRWLCRLHGAAAADGVLRLGGARDGVGRARHRSCFHSGPRRSSPRRSRGSRLVTAVVSDSAWPRAPCHWTSRRPASARPMPSIASSRSSRGSSRCSAVRIWASSTGTPRCSPADELRSPCSARPCRLPPPSGRPGAAPGILMEGMSAPARLARLTRAFEEAGGTGPKVLIRRVWLGRVPAGLVEGQRAVYESYAAERAPSVRTRRSRPMNRTRWRSGSPPPCGEVGADALNLRVQLPGMSPEQVREQIAADRVHRRRVPEEDLAVAGTGKPRNYRIGVQPLERWLPPSTSRVIPVICRASSDNRKHTAAAMSSASVSRPSGRFDARGHTPVGFPDGPGRRGPHQPGAHRVHPDPLPARSAAMVRVMAFSAALADA